MQRLALKFHPKNTISKEKSMSPKFSIVVLFVWSFLISCESKSEYGVYQIEGTITDSISSLPISHIRIIRKETDFLLFSDTTYTDINGHYEFEFTDFYKKKAQFAFKIEDVDENQNGGEYLTKEMKFIFSDWILNSENINYQGISTKTQNIVLQLKEK